MNNNQINLKTDKDFGETLEDSASFLRDHLWPMYKASVKASLPLLIPALIIGSVLIWYQLYSIGTIGSSSSFGDYQSNQLPSQMLDWLSNIVSWLMTHMMASAAIRYINNTQEGTEQNTNELRAAGFTTIFPQIGFFIIIILIAIPAVILLEIPLLYLGIAWSLAHTIMIIEKTGLTNAMSRSKELIKDHWWETFFLYLIIGIITFLLTVLIGLPLGLFTGGSILLGGLDNMTVAATGTAIMFPFVSLAELFVRQLGVTVVASNYLRLREKKEGTSTFNELDNWTNEGTSTPAESSDSISSTPNSAPTADNSAFSSIPSQPAVEKNSDAPEPTDQDPFKEAGDDSSEEKKPSDGL